MEDLSHIFKRSIKNAVKLYQAGEKGKAFKMLGSFRIRTLSDKDKKTLMTAGEMMTGNSRFYAQLGIKQDVIEAEASRIFEHHFINNQGEDA